jgi:uncharacterized delta-60 repeat protein
VFTNSKEDQIMKYPASLIRRPANTLARFSYKLFVVSIIALLISLPTPNHVHAAAGDLDLTFGNNGKVTTDPFDGGSTIHAIVIQADTKIITAGSAGIGGDFALARLNSDGSIDTSFGSNGKVLTDFFGIDEASAVAIQSDGKIVAAGYTFNYSTTSEDFALARYNSDGSLDSTFGSGGRVTTDFGRYRDRISAIVIQPDSKIVAVGITADLVPIVYDFALARYNPNGSLDTTFGAGGILTTDFGGFDDAFSVALQPNGKIIVAGRTISPSDPFLSDFALARYETNGSLDLTFGNSGKVTTDFFGSLDEASDVVLQSDGKIIAAGNGVTATNRDFAIARYDINGNLDSTFGVSGKVTTNFVGGADVISRIALQNNGKMVAAGASENMLGYDFAIARYLSDGSLDMTFGINGKVTTDFFGNTDGINDMVIQPDGKILTCGGAFNPAARTGFALARYLGDPPLNICMQDDNSGNLLQFNSTTGDYQFSNCRKGWSFTGRGMVTVNSCKMRFTAADVNGSISALANTCTNVGTASVQVNSKGRTFTISDRDMRNNSCGCQ